MDKKKGHQRPENGRPGYDGACGTCRRSCFAFAMDNADFCLTRVIPYLEGMSTTPKQAVRAGRNGTAWRPGMPTEPFARALGSGVNTEHASTEQLTELAEAGDFAGVLRWLRERSVLRIPPGALDLLAKAIRKGQTDLDGLVDAAYGEAIGFITLMLVRCQLHVEVRLAEASNSGGTPLGPHDIDSEGWLERVERLTRFLADITTARSRVQHITRLNDEANRIKHVPNWQNTTSPMDAGQIQARCGETSPRNGRLDCSPGRIKFP